jgi:hypothetical protein
MRGQLPSSPYLSDIGYTSASELERLANETMAHAEELERRRIPTPPAEMPQQVAQQ